LINQTSFKYTKACIITVEMVICVKNTSCEVANEISVHCYFAVLEKRTL